jgi:hypothetical protein
MKPERKVELEKMLEVMRHSSIQFYSTSVLLGVHPFIEMTGFMNEYINICEQALKQGIDFTDTSIHTGGELPIQPYQANYLGEKFGCIFATTFQNNPKLLEEFLKGASLKKASRPG